MRPPTDFELLDPIYQRHRRDFEGQSDVPFGFFAKIMIPIDIPAIAQNLGVDANKCLWAALLPSRPEVQ